MSSLFFSDSLHLTVAGRTKHSTPCRQLASIFVILMILAFILIRLRIEQAMQAVYDEEYAEWVKYFDSSSVSDLTTSQLSTSSRSEDALGGLNFTVKMEFNAEVYDRYFWEDASEGLIGIEANGGSLSLCENTTEGSSRILAYCPSNPSALLSEFKLVACSDLVRSETLDSILHFKSASDDETAVACADEATTVAFLNSASLSIEIFEQTPNMTKITGWFRQSQSYLSSIGFGDFLGFERTPTVIDPSEVIDQSSTATSLLTLSPLSSYIEINQNPSSASPSPATNNSSSPNQTVTVTVSHKSFTLSPSTRHLNLTPVEPPRWIHLSDQLLGADHYAKMKEAEQISYVMAGDSVQSKQKNQTITMQIRMSSSSGTTANVSSNTTAETTTSGSTTNSSSNGEADNSTSGNSTNTTAENSTASTNEAGSSNSSGRLLQAANSTSGDNSSSSSANSSSSTNSQVDANSSTLGSTVASSSTSLDEIQVELDSFPILLSVGFELPEEMTTLVTLQPPTLSLPPRDVYDWKPLLKLKGLAVVCLEGCCSFILFYAFAFIGVQVCSNACCCRDSLQASIKQDLAAQMFESSTTRDAEFIFEGGTTSEKGRDRSQQSRGNHVVNEFELVPVHTNPSLYEGGESSQINLTSRPSVGLDHKVEVGGIHQRSPLQLSTCQKIMLGLPFRICFRVCASRSYSSAARKEKLLNLASKNLDENGLNMGQILSSLRYVQYLRDKEAGVLIEPDGGCGGVDTEEVQAQRILLANFMNQSHRQQAQPSSKERAPPPANTSQVQDSSAKQTGNNMPAKKEVSKIMAPAEAIVVKSTEIAAPADPEPSLHPHIEVKEPGSQKKRELDQLIGDLNLSSDLRKKIKEGSKSRSGIASPAERRFQSVEPEQRRSKQAQEGTPPDKKSESERKEFFNQLSQPKKHQNHMKRRHHTLTSRNQSQAKSAQGNYVATDSGLMVEHGLSNIQSNYIRNQMRQILEKKMTEAGLTADRHQQRAGSDRQHHQSRPEVTQSLANPQSMAFDSSNPYVRPEPSQRSRIINEESRFIAISREEMGDQSDTDGRLGNSYYQELDDIDQQLKEAIIL